jgi:Rab GDP dissociation inhibitor
MLNVTIKEIKEQEKGFELVGVWEGEEGKCTADKIIIHPSYLEKLGLTRLARKTQVCRRTICIVDHQIPNIGDHKAVQIILPQNQIKRKNDVYIMMIGSSHGVSKKGYNIVIVSSIKESKTFDEDFKTAFELIGPIKYRFD